MDDTEGQYDASVEELLETVAAAEEAAAEAAAGAADPGTGADGGSLFSKFNFDTLVVEKLLSGNVVALCMAILVASVFVFLMYKLLTRQSQRDKAKEAKKKQKQLLKNQNSPKENKKKV